MPGIQPRKPSKLVLTRLDAASRSAGESPLTRHADDMPNHACASDGLSTKSYSSEYHGTVISRPSGATPGS